MIRLAVKNDIDKINNLGLQVTDNFNITYNIDNYLNDSNYIILVNDDSIINGMLIVYKNIDYFEILMYVVDKSFRNKGIGTSILNYFFANFCKKDDIILLEVSEINSEAIKIYEKFNFKTINVRKNYYHNSDALIMKKVIE